MARKIFINYRRSEDWGAAQALYQQLESELPGADLFMDVEGKIKPGDDFVAVLTAQVAACDVLLAVIGPRWAELLAARAGDPEDFVVIEIKAALDEGKRAIPVLVGGAAMPRALPEPIRALARMHAVSLRPDRFRADCQGLVTALKEHFASVERARAARIEAERAAAEAERRKRAAEEAARRAEAQARSPPNSRPLPRPAGLALGLGLSILVGFLVYWWLLAAPAPVPTPPPKGAPKINPEVQAQKEKPNDAMRKPDAGEEVAIIKPPISPSTPKPTVSAPPSPAVRPLTTAEERALRPKDSFRECNECPEMVVVPPGSFMMGSPPSEVLRRPDESPQHRVTIARPFAIGKFEVTFAEWDACAAAGGCKDRPDDRGWGRGKHPVIHVSWDDITVEYLPWLSRQTDKAYRLPTEAEWEYAARAGSTTPFWWGSSISGNQANYAASATYGYGPEGKNRMKTVPVDSFAHNPWGLYNVHGNVREWVQDCLQRGYDGAPSDGSAWLVGDCGSRRARGGSFENVAPHVRSASRGLLQHQRFLGVNDVGFRVARALDR